MVIDNATGVISVPKDKNPFDFESASEETITVRRTVLVRNTEIFFNFVFPDSGER